MIIIGKRTGDCEWAEDGMSPRSSRWGEVP